MTSALSGSLTCVVALFVAVVTSSQLAGCVPDDADPNYPVVPSGGPPITSGSTAGGGTGDGLEPNVPTGDAGVGDGGLTTTDGGFVQDAGPFLDAFDFRMDAPEPSNPGGDMIP